MSRRSHVLRGIRVVVPVLLLVAGMARAEDQPRAVWATDLQQVGYEKIPRRTLRPIHVAAAFIGNDQLAVAWISPDTTKANRKQVPKFGESAHLHLVVMDANTGRMQQQAQWPTQFSRHPALPSTSAGIVTCIDRSLRLLSPILDVMREQPLPVNATCQSVHLEASPSGRTILLWSAVNQTRNVTLLSSSTFATLSNWTEESPAAIDRTQTIAASDSWLLGYCGEPSELCIRRFSEPWRPFHVTNLQTEVTKTERPIASFVSDEAVAIQGRTISKSGDLPIAIVTISGTILFQVTFPKGHFWYLPVSSGGESFAVMEGHFRGVRSAPLDMYPFATFDRAVVYSTKDGRSEFSVKLPGTSPWTPWHDHDNSLALSRDGTRLAVISDGVVSLYSVGTHGTRP